VLGYTQCLVLGNTYIELVLVYGVRIHLVSSVRIHSDRISITLLVLGCNLNLRFTVLGYTQCLVLGNIYIELVSIHGVRKHLVSSVRIHLYRISINSRC